MIKKHIFFYLLFFIVHHLTAQDREDSLHIAHYDIQLSLIDFSQQSIQGNTRLTIVSKVDGLQAIKLDFAPFTVDSVKVRNQSVSFSHLQSILSIPASGTVNQGDTLISEVYYHGTPEKDPRWGGFYFSGEYAYNMGVAMTRLPHNYGRAWYPCLDVFTDKSTYRFLIETEGNKTAICGGMLSDTTHLSNGNILWQWELAQPIPSYLASIAIGDYYAYRDTFRGMENNIPIDIYTPPAYANNVNGSFSNLKNILSIYEQLFGPYRFDRIGYVGVNFNGGAMEHATNIGYPLFAINGNLGYQSLLTHELSHSWFGNLITCEKAEEMWINEGFARYCELLTDEFLYPGENTAKEGFRSLHHEVLTSTHINDDGYYALNEVPLEVTYGSTSYDKGALVVHTLRHYLGDTLFFKGITSLLQDFAFQNISSPQLFDFLSIKTGINLQNFYEAWINQPGFLHFSIDSIRPGTNNNRYKVYVKQKLHKALRYGNDNRIDLTFFSSDGKKYTHEKFSFSGRNGMQEIFIPFQPVFGIVDFYDRMGDAIIDHNVYLHRTGMTSYANASVRTNITSISDTVFMRIEHNLVSPDSLKIDNPAIYKISDNHYWRIEFTPTHIGGNFYFIYDNESETSPDYSLLQGANINELALLYRKDASEEWEIAEYSRVGNSIFGYLISQHLLPGQYTLGIANPEAGNKVIETNSIQLFPNPAGQTLQYNIPADNFHLRSITIYDSSGRIVFQQKTKEAKGNLDISHLCVGNYMILFQGRSANLVRKFIKHP